MTVSRCMLLRMRNIWDKSCRENQNTHFMFNNFFFEKSCLLWDNIEKYGGARGFISDVTTWRIQVACWISKTSRTHTRTRPHTHTRARTQICNIHCISTAMIILERASNLRYAYIVCLAYITAGNCTATSRHRKDIATDKTRACFLLSCLFENC
jgi:hypothetical protein